MKTWPQKREQSDAMNTLLCTLVHEVAEWVVVVQLDKRGQNRSHQTEDCYSW